MHGHSWYASPVELACVPTSSPGAKLVELVIDVCGRTRRAAYWRTWYVGGIAASHADSMLALKPLMRLAPPDRVSDGLVPVPSKVITVSTYSVLCTPWISSS